MRMTAASLLPSLLAACGGHAAPHLAAPLAVTRLGAADVYGPGIMSVSIHEVRFELARPAHVIVLRVGADGTIEPVFPQRDDAATRQDVGWHYVEAPEPESGAPTARILDPVLRSPDALVRAAHEAPPPASPIMDP